ncbi:predicted protein [Arabidopsis lyrata subsp. lyrata]|uniref:Predicted protein n=1 Tax=Arabidopsis lyrata subsp. lyrata TaxID=81972 RepID=D7LVC8_ARALL|nr:predicted protein [Arabidopsis lyrata subsp. lyrata]
MLLYAIDVKKSANILVITGDADFATPIASLKARGSLCPLPWTEMLTYYLKIA